MVSVIERMCLIIITFCMCGHKILACNQNMDTERRLMEEKNNDKDKRHY